jgi:hypothetical protein
VHGHGSPRQATSPPARGRSQGSSRRSRSCDTVTGCDAVNARRATPFQLKSSCTTASVRKRATACACDRDRCLRRPRSPVLAISRRRRSYGPRKLFDAAEMREAMTWGDQLAIYVDYRGGGLNLKRFQGVLDSVKPAKLKDGRSQADFVQIGWTLFGIA